MDAALLVARLLLALVFAVAGVAKLVDRTGSRQAIIDFGLPRALASPLGILLPLCELAVAAALIPPPTAWWGAIGALVLLLVFVMGIGANLARGHKPDCRCFGQLHSAPAGPKTLARNAALVVWQGWQGNVGPSALSWVGRLSVAQLAALVGGLVVLGLLVGQWWFLVHVLRQNGRLLVRVEALEARLGVNGAAVPSGNGAQQASGLPVGSEAPRFSLEGLHGETLTLESLPLSGNPVMLLFTDPGCGPCTAMLPEIGRWQQEYPDRLAISLISRGEVEENRAKAQEHGLTNVLLQEDWEVSQAYRVAGTPSAVLLTPEGTIATPVVGGAESIRTLVAQATDGRTELPIHQLTAQGEPCADCGKVHAAAPSVPAAQKVGEEAPEVKLPDLEGNTVELADFGDQQTLVLFWNPECGFCQQMLPDVREWEKQMPEDAPGLLFVSAGTKEANEAMGLDSPVVVDPHFAVGRAFGASGTPSAVLVDSEGKVASELAVGAPAVWELARVRQTGS
jgi:peroxiredoxin